MTIKELLIIILLVVSYVEGGFKKLSVYKQPFWKYADVRITDRQ